MITPASSGSGEWLSSPAALRNREPILAVLREVLPPSGAVLEIAAGSGEHAVHFAAALPGVVWLPTEADDPCLASIAARVADAALANLRAPVRLDVLNWPWPVTEDAPFDAIVAINMVHITSWPTVQALIAGSAALLVAGGRLILYGPFAVDGVHTAPSNASFDNSLRMIDPRLGIRDLEDVAAEAASHGLVLERQWPMPVNNLTVVFRLA